MTSTIHAIRVSEPVEDTCGNRYNARIPVTETLTDDTTVTVRPQENPRCELTINTEKIVNKRYSDDVQNLTTLSD